MPPENLSYSGWLPSEIAETIFLYAFSISSFKFPNDVCCTYSKLLQLYNVLKLCTIKAKQQNCQWFIYRIQKYYTRMGKLSIPLRLTFKDLWEHSLALSVIVKKSGLFSTQNETALAWFYRKPFFGSLC